MEEAATAPVGMEARAWSAALVAAANLLKSAGTVVVGPGTTGTSTPATGATWDGWVFDSTGVAVVGARVEAGVVLASVRA